MTFEYNKQSWLKDLRKYKINEKLNWEYVNDSINSNEIAQQIIKQRDLENNILSNDISTLNKISRFNRVNKSIQRQDDGINNSKKSNSLSPSPPKNSQKESCNYLGKKRTYKETIEYNNIHMWSKKSIELEDIIHEYINDKTLFPDFYLFDSFQSDINIGLIDTIVLINDKCEYINNSVSNINLPKLVRISSKWSHFNQSFYLHKQICEQRDIEDIVRDIVHASNNDKYIDPITMSSNNNKNKVNHSINSKVYGILNVKTPDHRIHIRPLCNSSDLLIAMHELSDHNNYQYGSIQLPLLIHGPLVREKNLFIRVKYKRFQSLQWQLYKFKFNQTNKHLHSLANYLNPSIEINDLIDIYSIIDSTEYKKANKKSHLYINLPNKLKLFASTQIDMLSKSKGDNYYLDEVTLDIDICFEYRYSDDNIQNVDSLTKLFDQILSNNSNQFRLYQIVNPIYLDRLASTRRNAISTISHDNKEYLKQFYSNYNQYSEDGVIDVDRNNLDTNIINYLYRIENAKSNALKFYIQQSNYNTSHSYRSNSDNYSDISSGNISDYIDDKSLICEHDMTNSNIDDKNTIENVSVYDAIDLECLPQFIYLHPKVDSEENDFNELLHKLTFDNLNKHDNIIESTRRLDSFNNLKSASLTNLSHSSVTPDCNINHVDVLDVNNIGNDIISESLSISNELNTTGGIKDVTSGNNNINTDIRLSVTNNSNTSVVNDEKNCFDTMKTTTNKTERKSQVIVIPQIKPSKKIFKPILKDQKVKTIKDYFIHLINKKIDSNIPIKSIDINKPSNDKEFNDAIYKMVSKASILDLLNKQTINDNIYNITRSTNNDKESLRNMINSINSNQKSNKHINKNKNVMNDLLINEKKKILDIIIKLLDRKVLKRIRDRFLRYKTIKNIQNVNTEVDSLSNHSITDGDSDINSDGYDISDDSDTDVSSDIYDINDDYIESFINLTDFIESDNIDSNESIINNDQLDEIIKHNQAVSDICSSDLLSNTLNEALNINEDVIITGDDDITLENDTKNNTTDTLKENEDNEIDMNHRRSTIPYIDKFLQARHKRKIINYNISYNKNYHFWLDEENKIPNNFIDESNLVIESNHIVTSIKSYNFIQKKDRIIKILPDIKAKHVINKNKLVYPISKLELSIDQLLDNTANSTRQRKLYINRNLNVVNANDDYALLDSKEGGGLWGELLESVSDYDADNTFIDLDYYRSKNLIDSPLSYSINMVNIPETNETSVDNQNNIVSETINNCRRISYQVINLHIYKSLVYEMSKQYTQYVIQLACNRIISRELTNNNKLANINKNNHQNAIKKSLESQILGIRARTITLSRHPHRLYNKGTKTSKNKHSIEIPYSNKSKSYGKDNCKQLLYNDMVIRHDLNDNAYEIVKCVKSVNPISELITDNKINHTLSSNQLFDFDNITEMNTTHSCINIENCSDIVNNNVNVNIPNATIIDSINQISSDIVNEATVNTIYKMKNIVTIKELVIEIIGDMIDIVISNSYPNRYINVKTSRPFHLSKLGESDINIHKLQLTTNLIDNYTSNHLVSPKIKILTFDDMNYVNRNNFVGSNKPINNISEFDNNFEYLNRFIEFHLRNSKMIKSTNEDK